MIARYVPDEGGVDRSDESFISWLREHFGTVRVGPQSQDAGSGTEMDAPDVVIRRRLADHEEELPFVLFQTTGDLTATEDASRAPIDAAGRRPALVVTTTAEDAVIASTRWPGLSVMALAGQADDAEAETFRQLGATGLTIPLHLRMLLATSRVVVDLCGWPGRDDGGLGASRAVAALSAELTLTLVRRPSGAVVRLSPSRGSRWADDTDGRRLWRVRKLAEVHPVDELWIDDPELATYAARHPFAQRLQVMVLAPQQRRDWGDDQWSAVSALSPSIPIQPVTPDDRHDAELVLGSGRRIEPPLDTTEPRRWLPTSIPPAQRQGDNTPRLVVATHDPKFTDGILEDLRRSLGVRVDVDRWSTQHHTTDLTSSQRMADRADVVWVDFASGVAEWYARTLRPTQRLVVRAHGYEVEGPWGDGIDFARVDAVVFPSEHTRERGLARWSLDERKAVVIPNAVEVEHFDRPKSDQARFTLGLLGWSPWLKRPDRAVALLRRLVDEEPRFSLLIKGRPPTDMPWVWNDLQVRARYEGLIQELRRVPSLRDRVHIEEAGTDVAEWLRHVGWILSPSDRESFHLAVLEGMASGSVPLIWERHGASQVFASGRHVESTAHAAADVLAVLREDRFAGLSTEMRSAARAFGTSRVRDRWVEVLAL